MIVNDVEINPNWNLLQSILQNPRNFVALAMSNHFNSDINTFINKLKLENQSTKTM